VQWLLNRDIALARTLGVGVHLGSEQLLALRSAALAGRTAGGRVLPRPGAAAGGAAAGLRLRGARPGAGHGQPSRGGAAGLEAFAALRAQVSLPIYALGGMGRGHIAEARRHGQGIAAIRGLWPA
jgi:8-oxo-dGTP diphosphatase